VPQLNRLGRFDREGQVVKRDRKAEITDELAMLAGGAAPAGAQTVNRNSLIGHYYEPNPPQHREVARAGACNTAGVP
jgi:hypothetical protein